MKNTTRVPACLTGKKKERKIVHSKASQDHNLKTKVNLSIVQNPPHATFVFLTDKPKKHSYKIGRKPSGVTVRSSSGCKTDGFCTGITD
jgi:hypothetical protein